MSTILPSPVQQLGAYTSLARRHVVALPQLKAAMTKRVLPSLYDDCSKIRSDLLDATLFDILPQRLLRSQSRTKIMPLSYHLAYFQPLTRLSSLYPDGTDPLHAPGHPFTHRLWAGGDITFNDDIQYNEASYLCCKESIRNVEMKGINEDEKIVVTVERRINYAAKDIHGTVGKAPDLIIENRKFVFMPPRPPPPKTSRTIIKPPICPSYTSRFTISPTLLFRFSALTFNAHKLHLSKTYARETEHHRNLLVHGPLTVILMLQFLTHHLTTLSAVQVEGKDHRFVIKSISYKNITPLYAEEQMKLCVRPYGEQIWETWIQGRDGGLAVKALVSTRSVYTPSAKKIGEEKKEDIPTASETQ
ncbi:MAG: hypothetical protein Q9182_003497 [Xanthomendoza sp. 2 TL-2023]